MLDYEGERHVYFFGLMLSPKVQREEKLLNCAAFLDQPSSDQSWQALKRLVRPDPERHGVNRAKDAAAVVGALPRLVANAYRRVARRQGPILKADELLLSCLVEQSPDPASRVTLTQKTDALGMPLLRVDWRVGELERRSALRLSELIGWGYAARDCQNIRLITNCLTMQIGDRNLSIAPIRRARPECPILQKQALWTGIAKSMRSVVFTLPEAVFSRPQATLIRR